MFSYLFGILFYSILITVSIFMIRYIFFLTTKQRMNMKEVHNIWYLITCIVCVGVWYISGSYNGSRCKLYHEQYEASDYKYSNINNICLLKDPVSGRFVDVGNYGRG